MQDEPKLYFNQKARDMFVLHTLCEIRTVKYLLTSMYAKVFDMPYEQAVETSKRVGMDTMNELFPLLAKYGDLDVPGLRRDLGL